MIIVASLELDPWRLFLVALTFHGASLSESSIELSEGSSGMFDVSADSFALPAGCDVFGWLMFSDPRGWSPRPLPQVPRKATPR